MSGAGCPGDWTDGAWLAEVHEWLSARLDALAAVVEEGSFDAAARRLQVTPSAVSQRVKALEQQAGQVLVLRSRPARPTAAGRALVRLAGQIANLPTYSS